MHASILRLALPGLSQGTGQQGMAHEYQSMSLNSPVLGIVLKKHFARLPLPSHRTPTEAMVLLQAARSRARLLWGIS